MSIIIGIDHGYYAIKTAHCSFAAGLTSYGTHEPYTRHGLVEFGGRFFSVLGTVTAGIAAVIAIGASALVVAAASSLALSSLCVVL